MAHYDGHREAANSQHEAEERAKRRRKIEELREANRQLKMDIASNDMKITMHEYILGGGE